MCSGESQGFVSGVGLCSGESQGFVSGVGLCSEESQGFVSGVGLCSGESQGFVSGVGLCSGESQGEFLGSCNAMPLTTSLVSLDHHFLHNLSINRSQVKVSSQVTVGLSAGLH